MSSTEHPGSISQLLNKLLLRSRRKSLKEIDDFEATALRQALGLPVPDAVPRLNTPLWEPVLASLKRKDILSSYGHAIFMRLRYRTKVQAGVKDCLTDNPHLIAYERCFSVTRETLAEHFENLNGGLNSD